MCTTLGKRLVESWIRLRFEYHLFSLTGSSNGLPLPEAFFWAKVVYFSCASFCSSRSNRCSSSSRRSTRGLTRPSRHCSREALVRVRVRPVPPRLAARRAAPSAQEHHPHHQGQAHPSRRPHAVRHRPYAGGVGLKRVSRSTQPGPHATAPYRDSSKLQYPTPVCRTSGGHN